MCHGTPCFKMAARADSLSGCILAEISPQMLQLYEDVLRDAAAKGPATGRASADIKAEPKTALTPQLNVQSGGAAGEQAQPAGPWQLLPPVTPQA